MPELVLLHFDPPYRHAGHYLLYAKGVGRGREYARRVSQGRVTQFPHPLVEAAFVQGSRIVIAAVMPWGDRLERRRMRRSGGLSRFCPICRASGFYHA